MTPMTMNARLLPLFLCLSLAACGAQPPPPPLPPRAVEPSAITKESRLTYANYLRIEVGMAEDQVRAILGDPAQITASDTPTDSSLMLRWKCEDRTGGVDSKLGATVTVYFKKGKVASKEANLLK